MEYQYKYKYNNKCASCKFLKFQTKRKQMILQHAAMFNGDMPLKAVWHRFGIVPSYESFAHHCKNHIKKIERHPIVTGVSENTPLKALTSDLSDVLIKPHEQVLDEFIDQFAQGVKQRQFKLTVKDGLTALKLKADIVKGDKDRKKDILKMMVGAYDVPDRPPERTET